MSDQEIVTLFAVGALAFFVGYHVGLSRQQGQGAPGSGQVSEANPMDWFTSWGKGL